MSASAVMQVEVHPVGDASAWNARVQRYAGGSIFQTTHWADYMQAYLGARPHYLVCRFNDETVGQLLVLESLRGRESLPIELHARVEQFITPLLQVLSWREGPLVDETCSPAAALSACLRAVEELAAARGITGIEETYLPIGAPEEADSRGILERFGYRLQRRGTVRIDLRKPLDDLWRGLKDGVARTPVRKAQRQGLVVREVESAEDVVTFYQLVRTWRQEQALQPFPPAKYEAMFRHLRPHCTMFLAEHKEIPLGGIGLWHFGTTAQLFTPVQSALARERRIYAGDLLYWHLIEWCHARGFHVLDFSGVALAPQSLKEQGIRDFKKKWGGQIVDYTVLTKVVRPGRWRLATLARRTRRTARAILAKG